MTSNDQIKEKILELVEKYNGSIIHLDIENKIIQTKFTNTEDSDDFYQEFSRVLDVEEIKLN